MAPSTPIIPKIQRQPAIASTPRPRVGAIIGTTMKTIETSDWVRAMLSPSNRSRMIAPVSTMKPAANTPVSPRQINRIRNVGASAAAKFIAT